MNRRIFHRAEEAFLLIIILLNIFDFIKVLPSEVDFIKKIISFTLVGYLLYSASLTRIMFNDKNHHFDAAIIFCYMMFAFKNIIGFAISAVHEEGALQPFYHFLAENAVALNTYTFMIGAIGLIILALIITFRLPVHTPSMMDVLHREKGLPKSFWTAIERFVLVYIVLITFLVLIFNFFMEWLTIAIDAPVLVFGIFFYLFIIIRYHKHFSAESLLYKVGSFGEDFYERFIEQFHYKNKFFLGIGGLLAFHLVADVGIYIIPYVFGFKDVLYFNQLGANHDTLSHLIFSDFAQTSLFEGSLLIFLYVGNIIAILFFLLLLPYIWFKLFQGQTLHTSRNLISLIYGSCLIYLLYPVFKISAILEGGLAGVDITTHSILTSYVPSSMLYLALAFAAALIIGAVVYLLERWHSIKMELFYGSVIMGIIFFSFYIWNYGRSVGKYYLDAVSYLFTAQQFFLLFYIGLFGIITLFFYGAGYLAFLYEIYKEARNSD